jgi:hypothetical protein
MIREIGLGELEEAISQNQPVATLLLDPSGNSLVFFRYNGALIDGQEALSMTPASIKPKAKFAITTGDSLAIFLTPAQSLQQLFERSSFPPQILVKTELTRDVLSIYKDSPGEILINRADFRLTIIVRSPDVPAWANELIDQGRLRPIRIVG